MSIAQIETNIQQLIQSFNKHTFIYDLLLAYDMPKASVTRLQQGNLNLSKLAGEIAWKKKLFFKEAGDEDLHVLIDAVQSNERALKHDPRFLVVTDYETLLAVDRKTSDTLDIPILEICKHFDFFLPWAGMEKTQHPRENPADVKAAEKMARLYDEIKKDNPTTTPEAVHNLNVFLSRLLFCFFAEDTEIFPKKGMFTSAISSHTQADGSDLNTYLDNLFKVLNTENAARNSSMPAFLSAFPYVNGGLFRNPHQPPVFTRRSRQLVIECGSLQWKDIHPDIFGSMIQAVVSPEARGGFGMHYTSVPNIMKVIEPLFLIDLYEEFEVAKYEPKRLNKLLERLAHIKIFDPACGSGNFLIIAYKELRLLEIKILQRLQELQKVATGFEPKQLELIPKQQLTLAASYQSTLFSRVELSQFYGIELDDFAHEVAILSLWLAQHQMNMKFKEVFGAANPTLPLQAGGNIVHGNAARIDWETVCSKEDGCETYLLGNPPYKGSSDQSNVQKEDMNYVFAGVNNFKNLDYIACWFFKGASYIQNSSAQFAFVTTNSISQGEQVQMLWPLIFSKHLEICFCTGSFKWENNAKNKAAVSCVIIGLRNVSNKQKWHFRGNLKVSVKNINPYLVPSETNVILTKRSKPLSKLPEMIYGNKPTDGGHLLLTQSEKEAMPQNSHPFIRRITGAKEFMDNVDRWCLWIEDDKVQDALSIPEISRRIELVREMRSNSPKTATQKLANHAHRFGEIRHRNNDAIIVPRHGSDKRDYLPFGYVSSDTIISDAAQAIYNAEPWVFGIISSKMHLVWIKASCGKIKEDPRYSSALGYNNFPFPEVNKAQKQVIERNALDVLEERENHSEKTLAELYDPKNMPAGLREAHHQLDRAVERCYRSKPFETDEERLEYLFRLYEQMISKEKARTGEMTIEQTKTKNKKNSYA